jgi:hypothetical protein
VLVGVPGDEGGGEPGALLVEEADGGVDVGDDGEGDLGGGFPLPFVAEAVRGYQLGLGLDDVALGAGDGALLEPLGGDQALEALDDVERFVTALRGRCYPGLSLESAVFPDEFHVRVPQLNLTRGLRLVFDAPR